MIGGIGGSVWRASSHRPQPTEAVFCGRSWMSEGPAAVSTQGRTKVVNAVHGMHAMHSVSIPRSVGC